MMTGIILMSTLLNVAVTQSGFKAVPTVAPNAASAVAATPAPTPTAKPTRPANGTMVIQPTVQENASAIRAVLSVPRTTFTVGEMIPITVGLQNVGNSSYMLYPKPPWTIVRLVITDQDGKTVKVIGQSPPGMRETTHPERLPAQGNMVLSWHGETAFDIRNWETNLQKGMYTIQGAPRVENAYSNVDRSVRSNTLKIIVK